VILDREWLEESSQVHWQQASAVPTTDCHDVQHAVTRDTDLQIEDAGEAISKMGAAKDIASACFRRNNIIIVQN